MQIAAWKLVLKADSPSYLLKRGEVSRSGCVCHPVCPTKESASTARYSYAVRVSPEHHYMTSRCQNNDRSSEKPA